MQELIIYLLKSAGLMSLFFAGYFFLLKNDTSFKTNRIFLLAGILTSILLPFLEITRTIAAESTATPVFFENLSAATVSPVPVEPAEIDWWQIAGIVYLLGLGFFLLKFFIELFSLLKLIFTHKTSREEGFYIIQKSGNTRPFSFFKFIVLDPEQHTPTEQELIIKHECSHARQWHSFDQILTSLSVYLLWFNPLAWLYRKSVVQNLEYLADKEVIAAQVSKKEYQKTLLKISVSNFQPALTNQFYQSFIKKRIIMLNKNATQKSNFWKTSLLLPFLFLFIFNFNIKTEAQVRKAETVSVSYSYDPDMHFAIITKDATDKDLEELKKDFSENGTTIEFPKVERSAKGEITNLVLTYKNKKTGNTGSISQSDSEGIPGFTLTAKKGEISFKTISETSSTTSNGSYFNEKIGKNPLIIISGKEYKKDKLNGKTIWIKGEMNVLDASEASVNYGKRGKDGAIIISEGEILDDYKAHLETIDSEGKNVDREYIWVREGQKPFTATLVKHEKKVIPNPNEINAIQRDKITLSNFTFQEDKPLIVVGGEIKQKDYALTVIDPNKIQSINVLKGETAVEKYGQKAKNGVVEIELSAEGEVLEEKKAEQSQESDQRPIPVTIKTYENPAKDGSEIKINNVHESEFLKSGALYVVDGKEMDKDFDPGTLDHNNIKSINILKGAMAIEKYGEKGSDGVLEITTKK